MKSYRNQVAEFVFVLYIFIAESTGGLLFAVGSRGVISFLDPVEWMAAAIVTVKKKSPCDEGAYLMCAMF